MLNKHKRRALQNTAKAIIHNLEKMNISLNNQKNKNIGAIVNCEICMKLVDELYKEISAC